MSLTVKQKSNPRTWTNILLEESERSLKRRKAQRELTFRRMYMSVFTLVAAGFVLYCSLFYVGAFFDVGKVVGVSQSVRAKQAQKNVKDMPLTKERTIFSPVIEAFSLKRVYLRKGQSIIATYSVPAGSKLTLKIKQCNSKPVLEVFSCEFLGEQGTTISRRTTGYIEFTVSEAGFYHFEDQVVKLPNKDLKKYFDYRIVWQRGSKKASEKPTRLLENLPKIRK